MRRGISLLIYYLTGYPPRTDTGGGGLANTALIRKGNELGHTIEVYDSEESAPDTKPDLYWLSNMNGRFSLNFLHNITNYWSIPFIVQDDGYQNLCPQPTREYKLCFQGRYLTDKWRGRLDTIHTKQLYECYRICRYDLMYELLTWCKASISVSPMHGDIWRRIFPCISDKQIIVEPQIDVDLFSPTYPPERYTRKANTYLYVGTIAKGKGYLNCLQYVDIQGATLVTAGDIHHTIDRSLVRNWIGHVPHERLSAVYSDFNYFIHLPEWPEPQGRTITEALLCGCAVIANDKVGAISYPWLSRYVTDDTYHMRGMSGGFHTLRLSRRGKEFRERIRNAPSKFWDDLGAYM